MSRHNVIPSIVLSRRIRLAYLIDRMRHVNVPHCVCAQRTCCQSMQAQYQVGSGSAKHTKHQVPGTSFIIPGSCIYRWCTGDMIPPRPGSVKRREAPLRLVIFPTAMSVNLIGRPPSRQAGTVSLAKCFLFYRWLNVGEAQRGPP